jgi:hypothetical protein
MKNVITLTFFLIYVAAQAQSSKSDLQEISINLPIIYNHSEASFYVLGVPRYPHGQATSYGLGIDYSRGIFNNFYGIVGTGYFKQIFGIRRPFYFSSPTEPVFSTQSYKYDNLQLHAGIGYRKQIRNNVFLRGKATYNWFNSFRQKYSLNKRSYQVNRESIYIGSLLIAGTGFEQIISENISVGTDALLPLIVDWKDDPMFNKYNYEYASDAQQIARNKFSVGVNLSLKYHL